VTFTLKFSCGVFCGGGASFLQVFAAFFSFHQFIPGTCAKYCEPGYVCLSVCLSVRSITRKPHGRTSPNLLCMLHMAVARSLWRHCDTLCTSGSANRVIFSHNCHLLRHVYSFGDIEHDKHRPNSRDCNRILLRDREC